MKITRLILDHFQQFDFIDLDFSYPKDHATKSRMPLDKICLIGKNGTGKTTIMNFLRQFLISSQSGNLQFSQSKTVIGLKINDEDIYIIKLTTGAPDIGFIFVDKSIDSNNWVEDFRNNDPKVFKTKYENYIIVRERLNKILEVFRNKDGQLLIFSPSEVHQNYLLNLGTIPSTNLSNALAIYTNFQYHHEVSFQHVESFWGSVIYQVKKRESDERAFLYQEANKKKILEDVIKDFRDKNPIFLTELSKIWNRVLSKAGLYFDDEKVTIPMQLNENLIAYIKLKSTGREISYSRLSSGIRHYIFRLGYIASLFYKREIKSSIVFIDEPENSLFPDILFDLVEQYTNISSNTQFFFATHSPIVAAQFEPFERIILDFNEDDKVISRKGTTAIGDDPSDILINDFGIESLLGKEGLKKWQRYIELKVMIRQEQNQQTKEALVNEFLEIGKAYNFGDEAFN